jgi:hypothetical protein
MKKINVEKSTDEIKLFYRSVMAEMGETDADLYEFNSLFVFLVKMNVGYHAVLYVAKASTEMPLMRFFKRVKKKKEFLEALSKIEGFDQLTREDYNEPMSKLSFSIYKQLCVIHDEL